MLLKCCYNVSRVSLQCRQGVVAMSLEYRRSVDSDTITMLSRHYAGNISTVYRRYIDILTIVY